MQRKCADDIINQEERLEDENSSEAIPGEDEVVEEATEIEPSTNPEDIYKSITLEKEININTVLSKTPTGRGLIELLLEGNNATDKMISQITHILCDCLLAVYGERPSTFHKDIIARSLVKTYPILASAASDVPHALWFHLNGRGEGRHAGKIHYRMEYFAKKSTKRVFQRRRNQPDPTDEVALPEGLEVPEALEDLETLIAELKFIVPTNQVQTHILDLWKKTLKIRNEHRVEETFLTFMNDFPVASAFNGMLLAYDYSTIYPTAFEFNDSWKDIQPKILDRYREMYRYIKNDVVRALAIVRQKNPTRGSKRSREEDLNLRKMNPLHGVIQWINPEKAMPAPSIPQIIIRGEEFEDGECFIIWHNVTVQTDSNVLEAFIILCKVFAVFNVACSPSDKLFYSFFAAVCHKVEKMSTTVTKFIDLL